MLVATSTAARYCVNDHACKGMVTDPLRSQLGEDEIETLRLFSYVGADPINFADPTGTQKDPDGDGCVGTLMIDYVACGSRPRPQPESAALLRAIGGGRTGPREFGGVTSSSRIASQAKTRSPQLCYGPPAGPKGISASDLAAQAKLNGDQAAKRSSNDFSWFKSQVQNSGPWDYKQYHAAFQDFGNYNYGYAGTRQGIAAVILRAGAGYAQLRAGTSSFKFIGSVFDDPRDQEQINRGISDARNGCS